MKKKSDKNIVKLLVLIILLITLALGGTYAFLTLSKNANNQKSTAGCFKVNYTGQAINATNLSVTTNYLEGAKTTVSLSKASDCQAYTKANIYIHTNTQAEGTTAPIEKGALKYKILNGTTVTSEGTITEKGATKTILSNVDVTTTATTYTIYIWIDSSLTSNREFDQTKYSGYIYADSTQTSTVK